MKTARIFRLEAGAHEGVMRFLGDRVDARSLAEGRKTAVVTVTRTGNFYDPRYGEFEITREMLLAMVRNFEAGVYGQKIVLDLAHRPQDGAAGFFKRLFLDGNKLRGEVEFTEFGIDAVKKRGFIYLSAEFSDNFVDNEQRKEHGPTLLGAALTPRPVIKRLDPVQLSEEALDGAPTYLSDKVSKFLQEELTMTLKELMEKLRKKLSEFNLAEAIINQLISSYEAVASQMANEEMQRTLMSEFVTQGGAIAKQLAESGGGDQTIKLDFTGLNEALEKMGQASSGLSEDDVRRLMEEQARKQAEDAKKLAEQREARVAQFHKLLDEAEGLKSLSEDQRKTLTEAADLITAEMTEDQVKALAEHQIKLGNQMSVSVQLSGLGYGTPAGQVHIQASDANEIRSLQEEIITHLRGTAQHTTGALILCDQDKEHPFVTRVLAEFDRLHAPRLHNERKLLAGGTTGIADTNLPAGFQRTVIREALSDLNVLNLIQTLTDFGATATTDIPYEKRDTSAVMNNGIVYEGQPIHRASISQEMDLAYILPMKLAFLISNEVMHFSRASQINWDAYARNVESNARVMRELIVRRICNELQRAADAYSPVAGANEAIGTQLDGATGTIKTANYPIVRPHQERDLKGSTIGSPENPITVRLNGSAISEYDGSGTQAAGTYYRVTNYNLGYIQFVDETGAPATPPNSAGADDISYSYATNVEKFDLDNGTVELATHLDGLLRAVGSRKAVLANDRFVVPNFQLMSYTLNNTITGARSFEAQAKRSGSDTNNDGDLEMVKGIPAFSTNAPGVDLGDERVLIGQRGTLTYTVAKPFTTGEPFEVTDATTGQPTGQKQAYGEEYSAIKVPTPIRNRLTSVLAYSFSAR